MMKLNILISKTANKKMDYLQIMSEDLTSVNIVLIAEKIVVDDKREE